MNLAQRLVLLLFLLLPLLLLLPLFLPLLLPLFLLLPLPLFLHLLLLLPIASPAEALAKAWPLSSRLTATGTAVHSISRSAGVPSRH
ncbi:MAG: hypothetical protein JNN32_09040 [Flavobacteriales bacterium]|nr:hypothetical protein [Flavobacteriales bacterium]